MRHKSCRTAVGLTRQSIFFASDFLRSGWMPGSSPIGAKIGEAAQDWNRDGVGAAILESRRPCLRTIRIQASRMRLFWNWGIHAGERI